MLIYLPVAQDTAQLNPAQASAEWKANSPARSRAVCSLRTDTRTRARTPVWCLHVDTWEKGQICINVGPHHEQWMDKVSASLQKRHQITRRCFLLCCRTVSSYGKVTTQTMAFLHVFYCGCHVITALCSEKGLWLEDFLLFYSRWGTDRDVLRSRQCYFYPPGFVEWSNFDMFYKNIFCFIVAELTSLAYKLKWVLSICHFCNNLPWCMWEN